MLFRLMCLYQNGVALGMEELLTLPRYTGHLVLEDWARRNRFSSFNWRARLLDIKAEGGPRDIVPPLYNSHPVKMPDMQDPQITLHGYERHFEGENIVAYTQYWVLLPVLLKQDVAKQNPRRV
jgi:hypothetical protein